MVVYYKPFTIFLIILYLFYKAFGGGGGAGTNSSLLTLTKDIDPALSSKD